MHPTGVTANLPVVDVDEARAFYMDYLGLSVFGTLEAARDNAVRYPKIIARVRLDEGAGFMIARTLADIDQHYSLWGAPEDLLARAEVFARERRTGHQPCRTRIVGREQFDILGTEGRRRSDLRLDVGGKVL